MKDEHLILLGQINGKQDRILERLDKSDENIESVSSRVTLLERWRSWILGAVAVLSLLIPITVDAFKKLFIHANH